MLIGGIQKSSLIDYPGKLCAILFTQGCPFRCPYCHNPELVLPTLFSPPLDVREIIALLELRRGRLDAVTITGGEPTLQADLIPFMQEVKALGYAIKLDSNGVNPRKLETAFEQGLIDYLAMDVKAPLDKYPAVVKSPVDTDAIRESIALIMAKAPDYEFRTTIAKGLLTLNDLVGIAEEISGARRYLVQTFVPTKAVDPEFLQQEPYSDEELESTCAKIREMALVKECAVR